MSPLALVGGRLQVKNRPGSDRRISARSRHSRRKIYSLKIADMANMNARVLCGFSILLCLHMNTLNPVETPP